jgi:hypothetical protein
MIARGFKSVIWVGAVGAAAIACYMVSLQVATERAELTRVEAQIIAAKRDIRTLQTELGTRGRMSQLEQWNAEVLALSAPTSAQFLPDQVTLARFDQPVSTLDERSAQVRMASAEGNADTPATAAPSAPVVQAVAPQQAQPQPVVRRASFTPDAPAEKKADTKPKVQLAAAVKTPEPKADLKKPEVKKAVAKTAEPAKKADVKVAAKVPAAKTPATKTPAAKASAETPRTSKIDSKLAAELKAPAKKPQGSGGN